MVLVIIEAPLLDAKPSGAFGSKRVKPTSEVEI